MHGSAVYTYMIFEIIIYLPLFYIRPIRAHDEIYIPDRILRMNFWLTNFNV
jgi:hypothetical protein